MSCKEHRQAILDSLATGENALPAAVNQHLPTCAACSGFYQEQHELFRSMRSALEAAVNQPLPPSLIPGLRSRLEENPGSRPFFSTAWKLMALPAVLVFIVSLGLFWRGTPHRNVATVNEPAKQISDAPIAAKEKAPNITATLSAKPSRSARGASPAREEPRPVEPEVIVLPEEREAFARFVARMPHTPDAALALTRPAESRNESSVEIALLRIADLRVEPLDRNN